MLTEGNMLPKQIASRLKISRSAVYQLMRKMREKGLLEGGFTAASGGRGFTTRGRGSQPLFPVRSVADGTVGVAGGGSPPAQGPYRLHGERFRLCPMGHSIAYRQAIADGKRRIEGCLTQFHRDAVQVYATRGPGSAYCFNGATQEEAEEKSGPAWHGFFLRLSGILGVSWRSVERTYAHYAKNGSEVAGRLEYKHKALSVKGEDGKIWFLTDGSAGKEDETIGALAAPLRRTVDTYMNDWRYKNPPTGSELARAIQVIQMEQLPVLREFTVSFKEHVPLIKEIRIEFGRFRELLDGWDRERKATVRKEKRLKAARASQQPLTRWGE